MAGSMANRRHFASTLLCAADVVFPSVESCNRKCSVCIFSMVVADLLLYLLYPGTSVIALLTEPVA